MLELQNLFDFQGQPIAWGRMGCGEPLVLIHGTPFSSQVWRKIAPLLAVQWDVYYFDLLGYGLSHKSAGQDVSLAVQNKLLIELFEFWGLSQPEVLCHDFGGATALRAYYLNAQRYSRLTIIDPVAVAPWGSALVKHVRKYEDAFVGLPPYAHNALLKAYLQSASVSPLTDEALSLYMQPWQGDVGQSAFYRQIAQMDQKYTDEIEPHYAEMDMPVKLLWGEKDEWIPLERGKYLASKITGGKLTVVPKSGHLMQEDAPEAIIAAMMGNR